MKRSGHPSFPLSLLRFWFLRTLAVWLPVAFLIFLMQIAVSGIIHDNEKVRVLLSLIDMLPPIVKTALGGESLQVGNVAALIAIGYNHPFVLSLYMLFAVAVPTGMLAGEVQRGTMELILSRPAAKLHVYACAGLISVSGMFALVVVMFLGTMLATHIYDFGEPIPLYRFFQSAINGGLVAAAVGAVSLLSAASFARRGIAVGVAAGYIVVNYFVIIIAEWWPLLASLKPWTLFHYANGEKIWIDGQWPMADMAVLLAVSAVAAGLGAVIWQRRDLPL